MISERESAVEKTAMLKKFFGVALVSTLCSVVIEQMYTVNAINLETLDWDNAPAN